MQKAIAILAATAAMLCATTAFSEDTNAEQRYAMERAISRVHDRDAAGRGLFPRLFGRINLGFIDHGRAEVGSNCGRSLSRRYDDPVEFWSGTSRGRGDHGHTGR